MQTEEIWVKHIWSKNAGKTQPTYCFLHLPIPVRGDSRWGGLTRKHRGQDGRPAGTSQRPTAHTEKLIMFQWQQPKHVWQCHRHVETKKLPLISFLLPTRSYPGRPVSHEHMRICVEARVCGSICRDPETCASLQWLPTAYTISRCFVPSHTHLYIQYIKYFKSIV